MISCDSIICIRFKGYDLSHFCRHPYRFVATKVLILFSLSPPVYTSRANKVITGYISENYKEQKIQHLLVKASKFRSHFYSNTTHIEIIFTPSDFEQISLSPTFQHFEPH